MREIEREKERHFRVIYISSFFSGSGFLCEYTHLHILSNVSAANQEVAKATCKKNSIQIKKIHGNSDSMFSIAVKQRQGRTKISTPSRPVCDVHILSISSILLHLHEFVTKVMFINLKWNENKREIASLRCNGLKYVETI